MTCSIEQLLANVAIFWSKKIKTPPTCQWWILKLPDSFCTSLISSCTWLLKYTLLTGLKAQGSKHVSTHSYTPFTDMNDLVSDTTAFSVWEPEAAVYSGWHSFHKEVFTKCCSKIYMSQLCDQRHTISVPSWKKNI